jgi:hypothetical protein
MSSQDFSSNNQAKFLEHRMLRTKELRKALARANSEATKGLKFGGFNDPWWSGSKWNRQDSFAIPDKLKDKFPMLDDHGGPHRPLEYENARISYFKFCRNRDWAKRTDPRGKLLRKANQYNEEFNGHAPKPYWVMEGVDKETGEREFFAGLPAKPIWRQPSKKQRVSRFCVPILNFAKNG